MKGSRAGALAVLLGLGLLVQLTVLWAPREDLMGFASGGKALQSHGEEYARGSIAVELMEGPLMPVLDYQWSYGFGGSLVMGVMAIPYFALFGESLFSLKLTAVTLRVLSILVGFLLLDRLCSRRAAWVGGLLLAVAPPGILAIGTIAWGVHLALAALVLTVTYLAARVWLAEERRTPVLHLVLGLAIGFTVYFGYGSVPTLALIAALELRRRPWPLVDGQRALLLVGAAIGFSPWLIYNARHDWAGLTLYGADPTDHVALTARVLVDRAVLAAENFAGLLWFRDVGPIPGALLTAVASIGLAILFAAALVAVWPSIRRVVTPGAALGPTDFRLALVLQPFMILAAMLATDFNERAAHATDVSAYRYGCLALPSVLLAAGVGADYLASRLGLARLVARAVVVALLAASTVGAAGLLDPDQAGVFVNEPGQLRGGHGRWILMRWADQPERFEAILVAIDERRSPEARDDLYRGMINSLRTLLNPAMKLDPYDVERLDDYRRARDIVARHAPPELLPD